MVTNKYFSSVFPAVRLLTHRDPDANILLEQTLYNYEVAGGNTFTGFVAGYQLSAAADGLVDSNNNAYEVSARLRIAGKEQNGKTGALICWIVHQ